MTSQRACSLLALVLIWLSSPAALAAGGDLSGEVQQQGANPVAIAIFLLFVVATLLVSYWASKRTTSSQDFYTAGGQITGLQNGVAIAGDYMSAASFLGISGLVFMYGFDGLVFALGALAGWPIMVFLLAKRVRNLGSYTFIDVVSMRLERTQIRLVTTTSTLVIVILYLIAQMVGAGTLIQLLFGLPYEVAVIAISVLVLSYITFGGMLAATWIQIIKAVLLLTGITILAFLVLQIFNFDLEYLFATAAEKHPQGAAVLAPGLLYEEPIQVLTIMVSMLFGTLGLPHILMRLFTVPNMYEAKKSALYASMCIGYFYLALIIVGFGAVALLHGDPTYYDAQGQLIGGNNMTAIHLTTVLGGSALTGFMAAVSFATILAVVAGLTVTGTAAISHDFYAEVLCKGNPDPRRELQLTRIMTVVIGVIAVFLGILFQNENVAFIATMPMVVSASVNFPVLFLSLFWAGLTTRGAIASALIGLLSSVVLIIVGPQVWVSVLGFDNALFPYDYPALFTLPLALLSAWLFSRTDRSTRATQDRAHYANLLLRSELGEQPDSAASAPAQN